MVLAEDLDVDGPVVVVEAFNDISAHAKVVCLLQDAIHVCHELHNAIVFEVVQRCSDSGLWASLQ